MVKNRQKTRFFDHFLPKNMAKCQVFAKNAKKWPFFGISVLLFRKTKGENFTLVHRKKWSKNAVFWHFGGPPKNDQILTPPNPIAQSEINTINRGYPPRTNRTGQNKQHKSGGYPPPQRLSAYGCVYA